MGRVRNEEMHRTAGIGWELSNYGRPERVDIVMAHAWR